MGLVLTINRQTPTINDRRTNVHSSYINTMFIKIYSRYKSIRIAMGFLEVICVLTRALTVIKVSGDETTKESLFQLSGL